MASLPLIDPPDRSLLPRTPAEVRWLHAGLVLPQHADDLLFTETAAPHGPTPDEGTKLISGRNDGEHVTSKTSVSRGRRRKTAKAAVSAMPPLNAGIP